MLRETGMAEFADVRVELRSPDGTRQHAWIVELDKDAAMSQLLADLVDTLPVEGTADDYELRFEGTPNKPIFVLVAKHSGTVRGFRNADS